MPVIPSSSVGWPTVSDLETLLRRTFSAAETAAAELILAGIVGAIQGEARQTLVLVVDDVFEADADGFEMWLPERPVVSVTSITVTGAILASTAYSWRQDGRVRFVNAGYCDQPVTFVYSHGFDPLPADIRSIALNAAARAFYNPEGSIAPADSSAGFTAGRTLAGFLTDEEKKLLRRYRPPVTSVPITTGRW